MALKKTNALKTIFVVCFCTHDIQLSICKCKEQHDSNVRAPLLILNLKMMTKCSQPERENLCKKAILIVLSCTQTRYPPYM